MAVFRDLDDAEREIWIHVAPRSQDNAPIQAIRLQIEAGEVTAAEVAGGEFGAILTRE